MISRRVIRSLYLTGFHAVYEIPRYSSLHLRTKYTPPPSWNLSNTSFLVWGAGTDVGKTLISAAYAYHAEFLQVRISEFSDLEISSAEFRNPYGM